MSTGIQYIKVNGTDKKSVISRVEISENTDYSTCQLTVAVRFGATLTGFNIGYKVIIKTDDDHILFYGTIRGLPKRAPSADMTTDFYTVQVDDVKLEYQTITVSERFTKNQTISEAIAQLLTNYTSDIYGTDNIDKTTYCPLTVSGISLTEAIKQCLSLSETPIRWVPSYDEGTGDITHNFTRSFYTSAGSLDQTQLQTADFQLNTDQIKNRVEVFSNDIIWPYPDLQFWFYGRDPYENSNVYSNRLKIALKRAPKSFQVFLIVGNQSADFGLLLKAPRMFWPNVKPVDPKDGQLIGFDPEVLLRGGYYYPPSLSPTTSGYYTTVASDSRNSIAFTGEVRQEIFNRLTPDSTIWMQSTASEGYNYGTVYIPTMAWMVKNISQVNKYLGQALDPDQILGWCFASTIVQPKKITKNDTTSQSTYGLKPAPLEQLKVTSTQALELYAAAKLKYYTEERYTGQATVNYWNNGTQYNTDYVHFGDLVDILHPYRGDQTDVCCQEINYKFERNELICTIGAAKNGEADRYLWLANRLKRILEQTPALQDQDVKTSVNLDAAITITGDITVTDLDTDLTNRFDNYASARMWFA